jgi:hypothetical protein
MIKEALPYKNLRLPPSLTAAALPVQMASATVSAFLGIAQFLTAHVASGGRLDKWSYIVNGGGMGWGNESKSP